VTHGVRMTSINAQKTVRDLVWRWVALGFSTMGAAMTIGRIPIEVTARALHHEADYAARANAAAPETTTVGS
jgi:hypothetical protein